MNRSFQNVAYEYPGEIRNIATPLVFLLGMDDLSKKLIGDSYYNKENNIYLNFIIKPLNHKLIRKIRKEYSEKNIKEVSGVIKSNWMFKHTYLIPSGLFYFLYLMQYFYFYSCCFIHSWCRYIFRPAK
jgi:hypothetical protein